MRYASLQSRMRPFWGTAAIGVRVAESTHFQIEYPYTDWQRQVATASGEPSVLYCGGIVPPRQPNDGQHIPAGPSADSNARVIITAARRALRRRASSASCTRPPRVTVRIGGVAPVPSPERLLRGLGDCRPGPLHDFQRSIDLGLRADVAYERTPPNPDPSDRMFSSSARSFRRTGRARRRSRP
jgi:hypothetical protein